MRRYTHAKEMPSFCARFEINSATHIEGDFEMQTEIEITDDQAAEAIATLLVYIEADHDDGDCDEPTYSTAVFVSRWLRKRFPGVLEKQIQKAEDVGLFVA
jgi:hypothetical protein